MGKAVKWPRQMNAPPEHRDVRFRYEFHGNHVHQTEDCIALKLEVAGLLKQGHLHEFLTNKGRDTLARHDGKQQAKPNDGPAELPRPDKIINYIMGGSQVSGVSYSTTKRHTRQLSNTNTA